MNFCSHCGHKVTFGPVPDDDHPRHYCEECGKIHYRNPRIIVGAIPRKGNKVLLCKRAIKPRYGLWTLPGGFMEIGEKVEDGAARETREEANANIKIVRLFSIYSLPQIGQVYMMFLADLMNQNFSAGKESLEVKLFSEEEIPWDEIAFSAIHFTLKKYFENRTNPSLEIYTGFHIKSPDDKKKYE